MATNVYTASTCDRCRKREVQNGTKTELPYYWVKVVITLSPTHQNQYSQRPPIEKELCKECFFALDEWLRKKEEPVAV